MKPLLFLLLLLATFRCYPATTTEITLGVYDYPPFLGEHLSRGGVLEELSIAIFKQAGYDTRRVSMPFARLVVASRIGEVDVIVGLWHTPEREPHFLFSSNTLLSTPVGLYKQRGALISFTPEADLSQFIIGMPRGYAIPPGFGLRAQNLLSLDDDYQALNMLSRGRIDLAIISQDLADYLFHTHGELNSGRLEFIEPALGVQHFYMAISRSHPQHRQLLRDFDRAFLDLHQRGTIGAIIRKHGFKLIEETP